MEKQKIIKEIFQALEIGDFNGIINSIKKLETISQKSKSCVFVVGPNGIIETKNLKTNTTTKQNKYQTCSKCGGDGYLLCETCNGYGYIISRGRLGEKNTVHVCSNCDGTGDIICPICKGSGKMVIEDSIENDINIDLLNETIRKLFLSTPHQTIIGKVNIHPEKIQYDEDRIYVIPSVEIRTLLPDEHFNNELKKIAEQFKLSIPIEIPEIFYKKIKKGVL